MARIPVKNVEIIAPNFKKRLSGVTSTIIQLIPRQRAAGVKIAALSPKGGLPDNIPSISWLSLLGLWRAPEGRRFRIWHARRNVEMIAGIIMRDILRMKLRLLFTSAAQRDHKPFTKWLIRRMDRVIATCARSGSFLEVPHTVIMHGVDIDAFTPPACAEDDFSASGLKGEYAIGCSGRIRHQKGTDIFVEAMIDLLPRYPQWTAIITGRVTPEHQAFADGLKARIAEAGLSERIIFLGEVPDIKLWYRRMTLYVAPSRNEGFGLTPLEAMASQTAVIASDAGAYPELIAAGAGVTVPADDAGALERAIEPYLSDPMKAADAGKAALAHVRSRFPLEREAAAIDRVYEETLDGKQKECRRGRT